MHSILLSIQTRIMLIWNFDGDGCLNTPDKNVSRKK